MQMVTINFCFTISVLNITVTTDNVTMEIVVHIYCCFYSGKHAPNSFLLNSEPTWLRNKMSFVYLDCYRYRFLYSHFSPLHSLLRRVCGIIVMALTGNKETGNQLELFLDLTGKVIDKKLINYHTLHSDRIIDSDYLLTHSTVQSPSWAADWLTASQEIPRISRNPKVHHRTHKRPPPVPILGQPNPVHMPTSHLLEIHPNIIHPSTPRSPQWSLSLRFPHQDPIHAPLVVLSLRSKYCHRLFNYNLPPTDIPIISISILCSERNGHTQACPVVVSMGFNINHNAFNGSALVRFHCDVSAICGDPFGCFHNKSSAK